MTFLSQQQENREKLGGLRHKLVPNQLGGIARYLPRIEVLETSDTLTAFTWKAAQEETLRRVREAIAEVRRDTDAKYALDALLAALERTV